MKLEYQFSGRRFFDVREVSALRTALEWFGECQELISGEGASPSLSPRRLRAKYTLRTNLRFMLRGFRPCRGQICACANLQSERIGLYLPMPPGGRAHGRRCCLRLHFRTNVQHRKGLHKTKSLCGCQKATAVNCPDTGINSHQAAL